MAWQSTLSQISAVSLFDTLLKGATGISPKQLIAFAMDRHPKQSRVAVQSAMLRMIDDGVLVLTKDRLVSLCERMSALVGDMDVDLDAEIKGDVDL